jgi:hypothetical protein
MQLLLGDLRALGNLATTSAGRSVALHTLVGLGLLGTLMHFGAQKLLAEPSLLRALHEATGDHSLRALFGFALGPCAVAATWLGLSVAQRQLLEAPELGLWRTAPVPVWRPALQVLLRTGWLALLWASALAGPLLVQLLQSTGAPWSAYLCAPLAMLVGTLPLLASLLAAQILLVRFFSGRWLRLLLALVSAVATVGFSTWLMLGLFSSGPSTGLPAAASQLPQTGKWWALGDAATMLEHAARGLDLTSPLLTCGSWMVVALVGFLLVARLHPEALEQHQTSQLPWLRRSGRRWPTGPVAVLLRKEVAQVLQQPGALVGMLVFAFLILALAQRQVMVAGILNNWRLPRDLAHLSAMLVLWVVAVLLVLYAHMGRIVLWDGPQWSLYMGSPLRSSKLLCGKLSAIAILLLWPLILVGVAGHQIYGARPLVLWVYLGLGLAGNLLALGVLALVGTWPRLMRPDDGGQIQQGGRSFLGALLLVMLFEAVVAPAVTAWRWLVGWLRQNPQTTDSLQDHVPQLLAVGWLYATVFGGLFLWIANANVRRLLAPR